MLYTEKRNLLNMTNAATETKDYFIPTAPLGAIKLDPSMNIKTVIESSPPGAAFSFAPGTYRTDTISIKQGQRFWGAKDAAGNLLTYLNGSRKFLSFTKAENSASYYSSIPHMPYQDAWQGIVIWNGRTLTQRVFTPEDIQYTNEHEYMLDCANGFLYLGFCPDYRDGCLEITCNDFAFASAEGLAANGFYSLSVYGYNPPRGENALIHLGRYVWCDIIDCFAADHSTGLESDGMTDTGWGCVRTLREENAKLRERLSKELRIGAATSAELEAARAILKRQAVYASQVEALRTAMVEIIRSA